MQNKTTRYIASACFAFIAIWDIIDLIDYFYFWGIASFVGSVLIVISLLKSQHILSIIGFSLWSLNALINLLQNFEAIIDGWVSFPLLLVWILNIVVYVLLMLASINIKSAKVFGTIAAATAAVRLLALIIRNLAEGYGVTISPILWGLLLAAGAILLGLTYDGVAKNTATEQAATTTNTTGIINPSVQVMFEDSDVEKLMRLKTLLDNDVITQEEFDAKKKQIIER